MNYVKLVVAMLLVVLLIAPTANAATGAKAKGERIAQRDIEPNEIGARTTGKYASDPVESVVQERQQLTKNVRSADVPLSMPTSPVEVTGFSGTVAVGASSALPTISHVVAALNFGAPVDGNVVFELTDAAYAEPGFNLGPITYGAGGPYTVTFRPKSGVNVVTTVTSSSTGGFILTGASNVVFEGASADETPGGVCGDPAVRSWTIKPAAYVSATAGTIVIRNGSYNVTVADCIVEGILDASNGSRAISMTNSTTTPQHHILIQNCRVLNAKEGIYSSGYFDGTAAGVAYWDHHISVKGCDIGDPIAQKGIFLQQCNYATIYCNEVHDIIYPLAPFVATSSGRLAAIQLTNGWNCVIDKNEVDEIENLRTTDASTTARVYGIRYQGSPIGFDPGFDGVPTSGRIANNCITRVRGNSVSGTGFRDIGIEVGGGRQDTLYHNTVHFSGAAEDDGSACVQVLGNRGALFGPPFTGLPARCVGINNIFSNDRDCAQGGNICVRPFNDGGVFDWRGASDYNVLYASGPNAAVAPGYATVPAFQTYGTGNDVHSVGYNPLLLTEDDCHWNTAGPSSASDLCPKKASVPDDIFGTARAAQTDAGAIEEATSSPAYHDAYVVSLDNPGGSGVPNGLPFSPFEATVGNSTPNQELGASVNTKVYDPSNVLVYDQTSASDTVPGGGTVQFSTSASWTPSTAGAHTAVVTLILASDMDASNDTSSSTFPVAGLKATFPYCTSFETEEERDGWFAAGDFIFGTNDLGVRTGSVAAVTDPTLNDGHYRDLGCGNRDFVYSPFFDLTGVPNPVISFFHSMVTEPSWDASRFEYSIDTGKTWILMGTLDDLNGVNWYNTSVYANAAGDVDCFGPEFGGAGNCGPGTPNETQFTISPKWTSNGDCEGDDVATGPFGYVYAQYTDAAGDFGGRTYVRFRYNAFTDGGAGDVGWAFDDFCLSSSATAWNGSICGVKFTDTNGNGVLDGGENPEVGISLQLLYFGVPLDTQISGVGGAFCFNDLIPGEYQVVALNEAGIAQSTSNTMSNDGTQALTSDVGNYTGSIAGTKWNDLDNDGVKDGGEPGLEGWTIELHADSCHGDLVASTTTDANGDYLFAVVPGTYYVSEVGQTNWNQTFPADDGCHEVVITGVSGTSVITGVNFGNWKQGTITVKKYVDLNGDGVSQAGDVTAMPVGSTATFSITKDGNPFGSGTFTLGNAVSDKIFAGLDAGSYVITETGMTAGWQATLAGVRTINVSQSGATSTQIFLNFKMPQACGNKFEDVNGNGVKDVGEPGLAGWKINISGSVYGSSSAVTDANGDWCIDSLGGGAHVISEVVQTGWTQTFPVGGTYAFAGQSQNVPGADQSGKDFGNFKNICISGTKYRDRNGNGTQDAGEEGLGGWQINVDGTGAASVNTNPDGTWQICGLGPGNHVVSETAQPGWAVTQPAGGTYAISPATSGGDLTGLNFGNKYNQDFTKKYRTFGNVDWDMYAQQTKVIKPAKVGKPATIPNLATMLNTYILQMAKVTDALRVGVSDGTKPYLQPKGYKDVLKTIWDKGIVHNKQTCRGFDLDNKGKLIAKRKASWSAKFQNNGLAKELLILAVNIALSDQGKTQGGLGDEMIYDDGAAEDDGTYCAGFPLNGRTPRQILAIANNLMTNWGGIPPACYARLCAVVSAINNAFSCGAAVCGAATTFEYDTATWNAAGKWTIIGGYPLTAVSYLRANPVAVPAVVPVDNPVSLPEVYDLYQNYPNPFNPTTMIDFDLPEAATVTLKVYNLLGQEVATLIDNEALDIGTESVEFDASSLSSGVYIYRLVAEGMDDEGNLSGQTFTQTKKMVLMK